MSATTTHFPSHESIATAVRNIFNFHPNLSDLIKSLPDKCFDFEGQHNREALDDIWEFVSDYNLSSTFEEDISGLVRDLAQYQINVPSSEEYFKANEL